MAPCLFRLLAISEHFYFAWRLMCAFCEMIFPVIQYPVQPRFDVQIMTSVSSSSCGFWFTHVSKNINLNTELVNAVGWLSIAVEVNIKISDLIYQKESAELYFLALFEGFTVACDDDELIRRKHITVVLLWINCDVTQNSFTSPRPGLRW